MLPLDSRTPLTTQLIRDADDSIRVEIHSRSAGGNWTRHAVAARRRGSARGPGRANAVRLPPPGRPCHPRTSTPPCAAPVRITGRRSPH